MEHHLPSIAPEAATDEPASLLPALADTLAQTFPPGARKPRHDGFTPAAVGAFLEDLAAHGIVEHAARAAGVSASAAYALRNRRSGRAFAMMWDAVLIHRSRARLAAENQQAATFGCTSRRFGPDGELIGSCQYRDNRLAMAMLSRLDRLAEREAPADDHLRALSEDLEDFLACAAEGGDLDAFVEARRPPPALVAEPLALPDPGVGAPPGPACVPHYEVWEEDDGGLLTSLPPPPGFRGFQDGKPGSSNYLRDLTVEESAAWEARDEGDPTFAVQTAGPDAAYAGIWHLVQGSFFPESRRRGGGRRGPASGGR